MMSYALMAIEKANAERHRIKRPISKKHVEVLLNHMEQFPTFALASIRCKEDTLAHSKCMWDRIAKDLNNLDDDVQKSPKAWARFWVDLRFKIRRKYLIYGHCVRAGLPWHGEFTPYQQRIVNLLTDGDGNLIGDIGRANTDNRRITVDNSENGEPSDNVVVKLERDEQTFSDTDQADQEQRTEEPNKERQHNENRETNSSSNNKTTEELNREMIEFELRKGKELLEIEKKHREEKHVLDISILELRKQLLMKELNDT